MRLRGIDAARGLALLGMMVVHLLPATGADDNLLRRLVLAVQLADPSGGDENLTLNLELELDSRANHHAARLQDLVPTEPKLGPIERGLGRERNAIIAGKVFSASEQLGVQRYWSRHTVQC